MATENELWERVEAVLEAALEASPDRRPEILDRLCGNDLELRRQVESLLAAHEASRDFLETSAASFAAAHLLEDDGPREPSERAGATVGRYRLIEEIGRGGMGAVWLAERADGQFEQRVALKLVKRGMDTDEILSRFLRERQILARLEHPHIARLLDGGASSDGRPYFVMEHVAGRPITEYCDAHRLSVDERLRLFVVVCRAVQYAHGNLVVHRDLKPTNVLVTEAGVVKLLDFGVARLLEEGAEAATLAGPRGHVMTPEYASPEQVAGEPVTTASDVYQLGILLYELLCGHRPLGTGRSGRRETVDTLREIEPRRPSSTMRRIEVLRRDGTSETIEPAAVSDHRSMTTERLRRRLRGDLDAITMRALRREPERRYVSAEALAEDVERHLAHLPIRAAGERFGYRAGKFIRRHRLRVTAAAVLLTLAVGGASYYTLQIRRERDRAQMEAAKATESAAILRQFFESWDPDAADRGEVSAERVLSDARRVAEIELQSDPATLAATLSVLGGLYQSLGNLRGADSLLARARSIQERLGSEARADLARTLARQGQLLLLRGRFAESERVLRRALGLNRSIHGHRHMETLTVQLDLALVLRHQERLTEAEAEMREILDVLGKPLDRASPFGARVASDLGYTLFLQARYDEAAAVLRPTLARQRAIHGDVHAQTLGTMRFLGSTLRDRGDLVQAEALYREAESVTRALYGEEHVQTIWISSVLSIVLGRRGEMAESEMLARRAWSLSERLLGLEHRYTGTALSHLGSIELARGDVDGAERHLRQALGKLSSGNPGGRVTERADALNRLAWITSERRAPDAGAVYREAVAFDRDRPPGEGVFVGDGYHYLAEAMRRNGDLDGAETLYRRALGLARRQLADGHPERAAAATGLGRTLLDAGRPTEAERYLREGAAQLERTPAP